MPSDFADVFAIKEGRPSSEGEHSLEVKENSLLFGWRLGDIHRQAELSVEGPPVQVSTHGFLWSVNIERTVCACCNSISPLPSAPRGSSAGTITPTCPTRRSATRAGCRRFRSCAPPTGSSSAAYDRSIEDIGALRLHDPTGRHRPVIAAGAPWYMTLFGRDALISSYMSLPIDPTLAIGVLEALAELQGREVDLVTEEEPGRIMHETRYLGVDAPTLTGGSTYYGSADATPLFVVLLGELSRWGLDEDALRKLLPNADRALEWMATYGDKDGDGYIEYHKTSDRGLTNQGWKDSPTASATTTAVSPRPPLALCEVQGYAYAAHRARAAIAIRLGATGVAVKHQALAAAAQDAVQPRLLARGARLVRGRARPRQGAGRLADVQHGPLPVERDRRRRARRAGRRAPDVAARCGTGGASGRSPTTSVAYDPMSYHCGTVWPHDGALCAAGLKAYGFDDHALTVANGLLAASESWQGRLPELFSGLDRSDVETPIPFPTSCSPQAWAAATPFLLLRIMLGMEPDDAFGLRVDPIPGAIEDDLFLGGVRLVDRRFNVRIDDGVATVREVLPDARGGARERIGRRRSQLARGRSRCS